MALRILLTFFLLVLSHVKSLPIGEILTERSKLLWQREIAGYSPIPGTALKPETMDGEWIKCLKLAKEMNECLPGQNCSTNFPNATSAPTKKNQSTTAPTKKNQSTTASSRKVKNFRLPSAVVPDIYDLILQPNMYDGEEKNFSFNGSVRIFIKCVERTNVIKIHTSELSISPADVTVWLANGNVATETEVPVNNVTYIEDFEWHEINLTNDIQPGKRYLLKFNQFSGPLKMKGFGPFLRSYKEGNTTRYLVASLFSPNYAREAFPCFDEPHLKAKFNVTLIRRSHYHSLSNMPRVEERSLAGDWKADIFQQTVRMSTYLVAFVVSQFANMTQLDHKGRIYHVWARPSAIKMANYTLHIAIKILNLFEKQFNLTYQLPKLDMVAVPYLVADAMENWGLIVYSENFMLLNPLLGVDGNYFFVTTLTAHEIAHKWFGNLVTLEWWSDLWLKEGFATWMSYRMVNTVYPTWKMELSVLRYMCTSMDMDSGGKKPVHSKISFPNEIMPRFDLSISYIKAAFILRMMEGFLGEDVFMLGSQIYLKENQYGNTNPIDVWTAFSKAADRRKRHIVLKDKMNSWIKLKGHPVLTVIRQGKKLNLSQKQFVLHPHTAQRNSTWHIPLTWTTKSECNFSKTQTVTWMTTKNEVIKVPSLRKKDWIIFNLQRKGYYRVNYDVENWLLLAQQLKKNHSVIDAFNRAQILHDVFSFARSGQLSVIVAFNVSNYLSHENEYMPVHITMKSLKLISEILAADSYYGHFQNFILSLVIRSYMRLGWNHSPGDDLPTKSLREVSIIYACKMQYMPCVYESIKLFKLWKKGNANQIPVNLRETVYCAAIRYGNEEDWNFLFQQMKTITTFRKVSSEKKNVIRALACTSEIWLLDRFLMSSLDEKQIGSKECKYVIYSVARTPYGAKATLDFFIKNLANIKKREPRYAKSLLGNLVSLIKSPETLIKLERVRDIKRNMGFDAKFLSRGIDAAKNNIKWMKTNRRAIVQWLKENLEQFKRNIKKYHGNKS